MECYYVQPSPLIQNTFNAWAGPELPRQQKTMRNSQGVLRIVRVSIQAVKLLG